jgi:hypothetical protein
MKPTPSGDNIRLGKMLATSDGAVVAIVRVTFTVEDPGVTVAGLKVQVERFGSPEQAKARFSSKGPSTGTTSIV